MQNPESLEDVHTGNLTNKVIKHREKLCILGV